MVVIRPNPTLSDDLIREILVRVPVKSLLCFQSVSKTWLSLIKDPAFVKSQLLHAIETYDQTLIGRFPDRNGVKTKFIQVHADSCQILADLKLPCSRGEFEFACYITVAGSANGIVCVAVSWANHKTSIYLWNPSIRQSKVIPAYNLCHGFGEKVFGFGYDGVDHDFKVVRVVSPFSIRAEVCAEVYSDNRNAWRNLPEPMDIPGKNSFDVCINGFLCGIGKYGMIAFNLNREVLNCAIRLPIVLNHDDIDQGARIIEFNNSVAVIIVMPDELNVFDYLWDCYCKKISMWALDNDACLLGGGVKASWTQMFSIDLGITGYLLNGYFSNGNLLVQMMFGDVMWISCNAEKKEAKIVQVSDILVRGFGGQICMYTQSLISLAGFIQVNWNADEDDN